jgi:hypothetical protein
MLLIDVLVLLKKSLVPLVVEIGLTGANPNSEMFLGLRYSWFLSAISGKM